MKLMIASDIHGSAHYLRMLLKQYKAEQPDRLLLLGDILYHGPRNSLPDGYSPKEVTRLLNQIKESILCVRGNCDTEVDQMVLEFPIMADYYILLHGQTHIPAAEKFDGKYYLNPGSVSIPKNGSARSYMVLEDGLFTWKDLNGKPYLNKRLFGATEHESK